MTIRRQRPTNRHCSSRDSRQVFYTDDVQADYVRTKARGAEFTMPPTRVTGSTIAMVNDTCGNLIQLAQLARR
jgi:predicted enzyme related to lactoylglutathione lyase